MRILALDQSSFCGWCHGIPGAAAGAGSMSNVGAPIYGTHRLPASLSGSRRAKALFRFVRDLAEANEVTRIYFEEPIIPKVTSFQAVYGLMGLATAIGWAADELGIPCFPVRQQTWRSEFGMPTQAPRKIKDKAERRQWMKQQSLNRCRAIGLDPADDNAADAIGIWWAMSERQLLKDRQTEMAFDFTKNIAL